MAKIRGLHRRGLTWYARQRVPDDVRPYTKKREVTRTLETRDYSEAKKHIACRGTGPCLRSGILVDCPIIRARIPYKADSKQGERGDNDDGHHYFLSAPARIILFVRSLRRVACFPRTGLRSMCLRMCLHNHDPYATFFNSVSISLKRFHSTAPQISVYAPPMPRTSVLTFNAVSSSGARKMSI